MAANNFIHSDEKYAGVIFDFNGVLLWDSAIQERAWQRFSERSLGKPSSQDEISHLVHGRSNSFILNHLYNGKNLSHEEMEHLANEKESIYRSLCLSMRSEFRLSPGSEIFLNFCRDNSIPCTIATASPKVNLDFFVDNLDLSRWFDPSAIVYDDSTFPGKPAPDIYILASQRLNLAPRDCIVIEDSIAGLISAASAGIGRIYAINSTREAAELEKVEGVSSIISQVDEVSQELLIW